MRKVIAAEYVSLDGVIEEPAWTGPYFDEDLGKLQQDLLFASDALLLGRVTYEGFAAAWPSMTDEAGFADRMNGLPKHVASTTLEGPLEWNASLIEGSVAEEVSRLKEQPGQNLLIYGSADLVNALMQHGLVDEYRLMVFPVVLGSGKRLFADRTETKALELVDSKTTGSGVVVITYRLAKDEEAA